MTEQLIENFHQWTHFFWSLWWWFVCN